MVYALEQNKQGLPQRWEVGLELPHNEHDAETET